MSIIDFSQLGLTETEGRVYVALLELGGGYASVIAKKAKFPRVNCYHTLNNLVEKEVISVTTKAGSKYFLPEPPLVLVNLLQEKAAYAKSIVPELLTLANTSATKPKIRVFEGLKEIKKLLEDSLETKNGLVGYSNLKAKGELFGNDLREYYAQVVAKRIKTRIICPSSPEAFLFTKKYYPDSYSAELIEILFVNPHEFWFEHETIMYNNSVATITLDADEPVGILMENAIYTNSQRAVFNLAWLGASSFIVQ